MSTTKVIDYATEDFTARGDLYDLIFDAVGKSTLSKARKALAPNGKYVTITKGGQSERQRARDLVFLKDLIEAGQIRAIIDRCYPLEQTAEAHRYVETGHKKGNVVITVTQDHKTDKRGDTL